MYKKILVALDGSDTAEMALPHACALAKRMGAELVLLRVSAYPTYDFLFVDETLAATLRQTLTEIHDQEATYLKNLAATLSADGLQVTTEHREGDAAHTILEVAQRLPADLIVMSTY